MSGGIGRDEIEDMARRKPARNFGIESIEIDRFRNFTPMTIKLGRYVTVISGQNGTGKSTLLGMLGQPFGMAEMKDVFGRGMRAKFTDMFKLSPDHVLPSMENRSIALL